MNELTESPVGVSPASPAVQRIARGGPTDPSHDDRLRRGILITEISRPVAWALTLLFLFSIYAVPLGEVLLEKVAGDDSVLLGLFQHAPSAERLRQFEEELEQASHAKEFVQPRLQLLLTRWGRAGNKKAIVGRGGFLYYEPGVRHLAGPGFLEADFIASREKVARDAGEPKLYADPRPAIFALQQALAMRQIRLVLFPVPDKAALQPAELHGRGSTAAAGEVPRNRDWAPFVTELRQHGVLVFEPQLKNAGGAARFLVQDTHWTPAWMQQVASELAEFVLRAGAFKPREPKFVFQQSSETVARVGDIVDMLKLPAEQSAFRPQSVTIRPLKNAEGEAWEPDPKSQVLLLGDSFTNVFSAEFMGWGAAAGLGPQLAAALGRGVDVIAQNDSGAFATREALAGELVDGDERLAGKAVVIWEFAERELSVGNWKPVDFPMPRARPE